MTRLKKVRELIKPGDVISIDEKAPWYDLFGMVGHAGIRCYQRRLFGKGSFWRPTHTTLYFSDTEIFSMTLPVGVWETLEHQVKQRFFVHRYTKRKYEDKHLAIMYDAAKSLLGRKYDIGDLLDMALNQILGYDYNRKIRFFEFSRRQMVCSTSVRTIQEKLRKELEKEGDFSFPRLFNKLNPEKWSEKELRKFTRTDVEMTTPAHYTNSGWFESEFQQICCWKDFE